jgi:1-deoxy-D-xylulose-5-phosphate reductoisomerase
VDSALKGLVVLGSTGSIGRQTLDVVRGLRDRFRVIGLAAGRNLVALEQQVREFAPRLVGSESADDYARLKSALGAPSPAWATMEEMVSLPEVDLVVVATAGKTGLLPTLAALRAGKVVALANKEVLVMAGLLVMAGAGDLIARAVERGRGQIRPIDSEHSAVWQCLWGEERSSIARIILTASGGAFRDRSLEELRRVTPEEALRHPTWQMGRKVTVDSATLLNKGFEAIEARWLFGVPFQSIEIVLHRQSIVHSLVEFRDGSIKAQMGMPDMRLPIQCALCYPERLRCPSVARLDLAQVGSLEFAVPDVRRFPCLRLSLEAGARGGTYPTVLAGADEVAVDHFLAGHLGFMEIGTVLEGALEAHRPSGDVSLAAVLEADAWARAWAEDWVRAKT